MKYLLSSLLVLFSAINATNTVKMPSAQILEKRLKMLGIDKFLNESPLIKLLADQELYPKGVANLIEYCICDYHYNIIYANCRKKMSLLRIATGTEDVGCIHKEGRYSERVKEVKYSIYEVVLKDYPEVLSSLTKDSLERHCYF